MKHDVPKVALFRGFLFYFYDLTIEKVYILLNTCKHSMRIDKIMSKENDAVSC